MTGSEGLTRDQMAWRVARDIPGGSYVNLGIGMPESVAHHLPQGKEDDRRQIVFHSENGILGGSRGLQPGGPVLPGNEVQSS